MYVTQPDAVAMLERTSPSPDRMNHAAEGFRIWSLGSKIWGLGFSTRV